MEAAVEAALDRVVGAVRAHRRAGVVRDRHPSRTPGRALADWACADAYVEVLDAVRRAHAAGVPVPTLAAVLDVSAVSVRRILGATRRRA